MPSGLTLANITFFPCNVWTSSQRSVKPTQSQRSLFARDKVPAPSLARGQRPPGGGQANYSCHPPAAIVPCLESQAEPDGNALPGFEGPLDPSILRILARGSSGAALWPHASGPLPAPANPQSHAGEFWKSIPISCRCTAALRPWLAIAHNDVNLFCLYNLSLRSLLKRPFDLMRFCPSSTQ